MLFEIAPTCEYYVGTDLSSTALQRVKKNLEHYPAFANRVHLLQREAALLSDFRPGEFDVILLNSVVQYFPGVNYLSQVLAHAVDLLAPGGYIFIGDVRNLLLLEAFQTSITLSRIGQETPAAEVWQQISQRCFNEEELLLSPGFFQALPALIPQIANVEVLLKRGTFMNELTRFRYDVILQKGPVHNAVSPVVTWSWQAVGGTLDLLGDALKQTVDTAIRIRQIPDKRLQREIKHVDRLKRRQINWLADLDQAEDRESGVEVEAVFQLADALGYAVVISPPPLAADGTFEAVFFRASEGRLHNFMDFTDMDKGAELQTYANNPLSPKVFPNLSIELRQHLKARLPEYMLPAAIVMLRELPLTGNGKIDRRLMATYETRFHAQRANYVLPQTPLQELVAAVWSEVLGTRADRHSRQLFRSGRTLAVGNAGHFAPEAFLRV